MNDFIEDTSLTDRACCLSALGSEGIDVISGDRQYYEVVNFDCEGMYQILREDKPEFLINYLTGDTRRNAVCIFKKDRNGGAYREIQYLPKERRFRARYPFVFLSSSSEKAPESFGLRMPRRASDVLKNARDGIVFANALSPTDGSTLKSGMAYFFSEELRREAINSGVVHNLEETFSDLFLEEAIMDFVFKRREGVRTEGRANNKLSELKNLMKDRKPRAIDAVGFISTCNPGITLETKDFQFKGKIPGIALLNSIELMLIQNGAEVLLDNGDVLGYKLCGIFAAFVGLVAALGSIFFSFTSMLIFSLIAIIPFVSIILYHRGVFDFIFDGSRKEETEREEE